MKTILKLFLVSVITLNTYAQEVPIIDQINVSGIILDEDGNPFPNVSILVKGTEIGTQTDVKGNYSIAVNTGEVLTYSFKGYSTSEAYVNAPKSINITMTPEKSESKDVVVTALGLEKKKDEIATAYRVVDNKLLTQSNNADILSSLAGKVSGLTVLENSGDIKLVLRGNRSIRSDNSVLIVLDNVITSVDFVRTLDPRSVKSVNVIKGAAGSALYGSQGSNGVLVIKTSRDYNSQLPVTNTTSTVRKPIKYKGKLKVKTFNNKSTYIKALSKTKTNEAAYKLHTEDLKDKHQDDLGYYVDVYDFFLKAGAEQESKAILNDIIKEKYDNYELLRALGYKLEAAKNYRLASSIYKRVLLLRPQDAQSYRDLALMYQKIGKNQKAFELLNTVVSDAVYNANNTKKSFAMNEISKHEINNLIQSDNIIDKTALDSYNEINTNYDVRVVIDWNRADTDIELHVVDPNLEDCFYRNPKTQIGGEIAADLSAGYGPEEFTLRNARKGDYYVKVNYKNVKLQDDENPTFMKVTTFKNYGTTKETKEVKVVRLVKNDGEQVVAKISI